MKLYVIQCLNSYVGNFLLFWGPDRRGYTVDLDKAGKYTLEEALKIEKLRGTDKAIPLEVAERATIRVVDDDLFKREMANYLNTVN